MKSVQMILSACCFGVLLLAGCAKDNTTDCTKITTGSADCFAAAGCYFAGPSAGAQGPSGCLAATACGQFSSQSSAVCQANNFNNNQCAYTAASAACAVTNCTVDSTKTYCCSAPGTCTQALSDTTNCKATGAATSVTCASVATACQIVKGTASTVCCASATCTLANTSDDGCASPSTTPASCN